MEKIMRDELLSPLRDLSPGHRRSGCHVRGAFDRPTHGRRGAWEATGDCPAAQVVGCWRSLRRSCFGHKPSGRCQGGSLWYSCSGALVIVAASGIKRSRHCKVGSWGTHTGSLLHSCFSFRLSSCCTWWVSGNSLWEPPAWLR